MSLRKKFLKVCTGGIVSRYEGVNRNKIIVKKNNRKTSWAWSGLFQKRVNRFT